MSFVYYHQIPRDSGDVLSLVSSKVIRADNNFIAGKGIAWILATVSRAKINVIFFANK
jgi:hypothetical protein